MPVGRAEPPTASPKSVGASSESAEPQENIDKGKISAWSVDDQPDKDAEVVNELQGQRKSVCLFYSQMSFFQVLYRPQRYIGLPVSMFPS